MAVENELIYIVRLNAEGEEEVVKARRVIDDTGKAATKSEKQVGKLGSGMKSAGKSTKNFTKQNSAANNALLDLTRIAQDAPYGIRGIANNMEQAALSSGRAVTQFGGVTGAIKGMGSALTGPLGIVAGITAFNLVMMGAESGLFSFGEAAKDFTSDAEEMVERITEINKELNELQGITDEGFFSTEATEASLKRINLAEEDFKDRLRDMERLREDADFRSLVEESNISELESYLDELDFYPELDEKEAQAAYTEYAHFLKSASEDLVEADHTPGLFQYTDERQSEMAQLRADVEAFADQRQKLENQIAQTQRMSDVSPTLRLSEGQREWNTQLQEWDETWESIQKGFEEFDASDIETPFFGEEDIADDFDKISAQRKAKQTKEAQERIKAQQKVEREIQQMQIQFARNTGNRIQAINMEEQQRIEQIRNNELIDKEQKERAITEIERKYAQQRKQIAEQEAAEKEAYEQRLVQSKIDAAAMVTNALQGFGSVIAGQSEENARQRFEANKAFNYAAAVMNTAQAVTRALPNPFAASAAAAAGAIQIAKIASQKFQPGGYGGAGRGSAGGGSVGYRGFSFSNPAQNATNNDGRPSGRDREDDGRSRKETRSIKIVDGMGNMVAKGQEEIDRGGGDNYMRGG